MKRTIASFLFLFSITAHSAVLVNYQFESNLDDSSGYDNHASTTEGAAAYGAGQDGQGLVMDGNDVFSLPDNTIRSYQEFELSFYFNTTGTDMPILGYQNTTFGTAPIQWIPIAGITPGGNLRVLLVTDGTWLDVASAGAVNDGNWHSVRVVGSSGSVEAFLDDVSIGSESNAANHLAMQYNYIGGTYSNTYFSSDYYIGSLDDFIFSAALAAPPTSAAVPLLGPQAALLLFALLGLSAYRRLRKG